MHTPFSIIAEDLQKVEAQFKKDLASNVPLIRKVGEYVLSSGGKRIRPALLLLSARLSGYEGERHVPLASVVEFIHTATLLHDDVVDNAHLRRGNASANTLWGNEASVLVGDFLFSKSFSLMVADGDLNILRTLSDATTQIAEGEVLQLICTSDVNMTEERYLEVIRSKTAILISAACRAGGILGGVGPEKEEALAQFGMELGIAFQLMDDTLDYISNEEEFGKSIGHDLEEGKVTLPLIYTLLHCSGAEHAEICEIIVKDELEPDDFQRVNKLVQDRGGIDYTVRAARTAVEKSKTLLQIFDDSPQRQALLDLADYVLTRNR